MLSIAQVAHLQELAKLRIDVALLGFDARRRPVVQVTDVRGTQPPYCIRNDGTGRDWIEPVTHLTDQEAGELPTRWLAVIEMFPTNSQEATRS